VLDDAAYNNDIAATAGTASYASSTVSWTGDLAVGASVTITYTVTVNNPDTGNRTLANTVTSATPGSNCPASGGDARCTATVTVVGADSLTFTQTAASGSTVAGGVVAYTITIVNSAGSPYTGASFADPLGGVLDDAAWDNDAAASGGTVSFDGSALSWAGDVPANGTITLTYTVTVHNPDTGNMILASTITSPSADSNCPAASPGPRCTATVTVSALLIGFITVADTGPTPYTGATITDDLSGLLADAAYGNAAATTGTVSYTSPILSWTGALAPGQTATITYSVTVNNPDTGDKQLVNTVTSTTQGSNCPPGGTGPACTATVTDLIPALTITKTASVSTTSPGSTVGYTITVADTGQTSYSPATVTDSLSGVLDDAAYGGGASATIGSVSYTAPVLTWTGSLNPGDTATITYSVTVDNPDTGGKVLSNAAASADPGSTCPAGSTGSPCGVTVPVIGGALTITAPDNSNLGTASVGSNLSGDLGTVQVTDNRGFGAGWTATVSSTGFAAGTGTPADTIPVSDASYNITALSQATGPATFTPVPVTELSTSPQPVVSATNVTGNTTATWNPIITVTVPPTAIVGLYTATIAHSVS